MKKGFTIVELLVASVISIVILTGVGVAYSSGLRLLRIAMAESELSLSSRQLRDRLLFRLSSSTEDGSMAGLLSLSSEGAVTESSANPNIIGDCISVGDSLSDVSIHAVKLALDRGSLVDVRSFNQAASREWLRSGSFSLVENKMADIATTDFLADNARLISLDLTLRAKVLGVELIHPQRISIPVFGREQP